MIKSSWGFPTLLHVDSSYGDSLGKQGSLKFRAFWNIAPCSLFGVDRRFRGIAYCVHHQGNLYTRRRENLKSHKVACRFPILSFWRAESSVGLHENCPLLLSDYEQNWNLSPDCRKIASFKCNKNPFSIS
jgi:hypothetical protein